MRGVAAVTAGVITAGLIAGCSAAGSGYDVHGPAFDFDASASDDGAGTVGDAAAPGDATPASPADASAVDATLADSASNAMDGAGPLDATLDGDVDAGAFDASDAQSAHDASDAGPPGDAATCMSSGAIVGGSTGAIFGATSIGGGAFTVQTLTGSVTTPPALVPFGGGFQALVTVSGDAGGGNAVAALSVTGTTWSSLARLGGGAEAIDGPALAAVGTTMQAAFLSPQHLYFHATFSGTWNTGADRVQPPNDAGAQAFGPVRAAAAGTATQLVLAYEGDNSLPYAQTWTMGGGWDDGVALASSPVVLPATTPLAIAPLSGGGASDLVAVYVDGEGSGSMNNLHLFAVTRNTGTTNWSAPTEVGPLIYTAGGSAGAPSMTAMSGGRVLLAWSGQSGGAYSSVYTGGASAGWSAAVRITSSTLAPNAPPSVASGVCGDDAEATYVSGGAVYTSRFVGGAWTTPALLAGVSGASFATIATSP